MNIIGKSREVFVLPFIDEPQVTQMQKKNQVFIAQALKDNVCIDFVEMLDRQLSIQPDDVLFNSKNKLDAQRSKTIFRTAANFKLQAQNRGMVTQRDKGKNACEKVKLPQIQTVFDSPAPQDDIDQFLESPFFLLTIRFFAILYFTGLLLTDYSYRLKLQQNPNEKNNFHMSSSNIVSHHFQLLSNCAFTLQIILRMFSKKSFFHNPWNIVTFVGCLACWSCLFMDLPKHDGQPLFHLFFILKILFGVRIIEVFQFIKNPFQSFIKTIPQLRKIFFPYLIFIAMYSVLGLTLFSGANQYKCRETQQPVNGEWNQVSSNLCGASQFHCKSGFCGNPYEYGLSYNLTQRYQYGNQFGLVSFDNIGSALLITYHYVFLSNWTAIMYKFSRYMNPYMTVFYFFTLALFLFFIMSNLNMITMCKTFIENEKQKEKFKPKQNEKEQAQSKSLQLQIPEEIKKVYNIVKIIDIFLIIGSAIVILIEYEGMSKTLIQLTNKIDFALTLSCLLTILIQTIILKKQILKDKLLILDWISITFSLADFIYCLVHNDSIFDPEALSSRAFRSVKIVRILKIFYFSKTWFTFQKTMLRMFVQTLDTVKYFFVLLLSVVVILAMIGQNLFANSVRLNTATRKLDIEHGQPFVTNFDSIYKAIVAVILMLQNERWTQTMYNYYSGAGWKAVGYFTIAVFIIHLLLTRLFLAIFLCYFRRNLQKTSEIEQKTLTQTKSGNHRQSIQSNAAQISQFLQNQSQKMNEMDQQRIEQQKQIHFMFFRRNHCFFQLVRACYNSLILHRVLIAMILLHCLTIILRTNQDDPSKTQILNIFQTIALYFYAFQLLLGVLGFGLYSGQRTYLKQSIINYLNIIVLLLTIVSEFKFLGQLQTNLIRRFTILKILTFFTRTNKETEIVLGSISAISKKFIRMIAMYMFLLILSCTLPLKLEKHKLTTCYNYPSSQLHPPSNYHQCMLVGGDWVNDPQKFANIFQSIVLMYQVVTSESWTYFIQMFGHSSPWDIFFVLNFFVYNICLLNIFVGITVQTYLSLKDEAYKLNLLRPNQRMWLLIRNSINSLIPTPIIQQKEGGSVVHKLAFYIISQPIYENFIDVLPYINMLFYALRYYRADVIYLSNLNIANNVFLTTFMIDTFLKLQLRSKFFYLDNSRIQLAGFIYHIAYGLIFLIASPNQESQRALRFVSALLLILRCKKLLFRFTWSKTLLNSVLEVLPKCVIIGQLLMIILFFYVSIGMEIFKYTKPTPKSDGYVTGFNNAFTSLITLLKIVSNESWFDQVAAFVRPSSPIDICFPVNTIQDAIIHPGLGCGSKAGYLYFITFHMIIALLVMNLLIATMVAAYDQNYEKQYKSVNIFQLQDCLKLWKKYDPDGTGVIPYKQFWRLSSEIAILFGISKKKLIKGKQKFLEQLDIEVCQPIDRKNSSVLCYKFHDVLTKFSKIKLTVSKADCDQNNQYADFQIHPLIEHEIKDYITKVPALYENIKPYKNYKSGEMKYFFGLLRKMRAWRIVAKKKDSSVISKLSHIIQLALQKKQKQQAQMSHIRSSISNMHFS